MIVSSSDRTEFHDLLCRFFLAFDERDWDAMEATLAPEVAIDYASSGREPPSVMTGRAFVDKRRAATDTLSKQHNFSNLLVAGEDGRLVGRCNYLILRFAPNFDDDASRFFHSTGTYRFGASRHAVALRIDAIKQTALRSWGERELHGGSRRSPG